MMEDIKYIIIFSLGAFVGWLAYKDRQKRKKHPEDYEDTWLNARSEVLGFIMICYGPISALLALYKIIILLSQAVRNIFSIQ